MYEQIEKSIIQENGSEDSENNTSNAKKVEKISDESLGDHLNVPTFEITSSKPLEKSVSSPRLGKPMPEKEVVTTTDEKKEKEKDKAKEKMILRKKDIKEIATQSSILYRCFLFFFTCCYLSKFIPITINDV